MPIVHPCRKTGCSTLTMGERCLEHELARDTSRRARAGALTKRFKAPAIAIAIAAAAALAGRATRT
jgi:hypothetical protein